MQLGFVSLILRDLPLNDVLAFAAKHGFQCVELMCWPAESTGVTHLDVDRLSVEEVKRVNRVCAETGVRIASLGYYANPLTDNELVRNAAITHLGTVMDAAVDLDVPIVNTYVGRNPKRTIDENWPLFERVWTPVIERAASLGLRIGTENCPMLFSNAEWPGGVNMSTTPAIWREMFHRIPSPNFGLVFDPSHLLWLGIDHLRALREFSDRLITVQIKDEKIDHERLYERGVMEFGWHYPKIPGLGDIDWAAYWRTLHQIGFDGDVLIEVQDRAFGTSLEERMRATLAAKQHVDLSRNKGALVDA
jgi:sugar phosphate isomerase/epimerase